jgi:hypothetical protein
MNAVRLGLNFMKPPLTGSNGGNSRVYGLTTNVSPSPTSVSSLVAVKFSLVRGCVEVFFADLNYGTN